MVAGKAYGVHKSGVCLRKRPRLSRQSRRRSQCLRERTGARTAVEQILEGLFKYVRRMRPRTPGDGEIAGGRGGGPVRDGSHHLATMR